MEKTLIGLILAFISTFLIGISFVFKKTGLIRSGDKGLRASHGGYTYLNDCYWWCGMILMSSGEILNFAAYSFAPASLVTPLGALSVLVTAVASSIFLNENLNIISKIGCILCITGSIVIIIHAPEEKGLGFSEVYPKLYEKGFMMYLGTVLLLTLFLILYVAPRYAHKTPLIYVLITGSLGSITVIFCKLFGLLILQYISASSQHSSIFIFIFFIISISILIIIQITYLNRALDIFNISIVTPILYVIFTSFVLLSSCIVFSEMSNRPVNHHFGLLAGFITVVMGIVLINSFQNLNQIPTKFIHLITQQTYLPETI